MSTKSKHNLTVEETYKKKTHHEHILSVPDTYIGTISPDTKPMYVYNFEKNRIIEDVIEYIAGYFKIFDEILINGRDHTVRDPTCRNIKINIDCESGKISVWNDGLGIPVCLHNEYNIYLPELIFGHLLTSSNYDKKGKTVGGKNGYGAKLTNIYSKQFTIHTIGEDKEKGKKEYIQVFEDNMFKIGTPIIKDVGKKTATFTCISYIPDYAKFGMHNLTDDMYNLLVKRCYDLAACTTSDVKVWVNDVEIACRNFKDYINMYYDKPPNLVYKKLGERWEVGIVFDRNEGDKYISFVNGILTYQGGTHVGHVVDTVVKKVSQYIKSLPKYKNLKIQPALIKQYLTFFINCVIEDPGFNSQVKEFMNSKIADWCQCGKNCNMRCEIDDDMIKELCETGLMQEVVEISEFKELKELSKTDGKKVGALKNIEKLIDANWAGKRNSHKTSLILTEGDSAKAFAVAGLSIIGRDAYGIFPLKGKLLNVRNATAKQIKSNAEFTHLKLILGLKQGMKYTDVSKLRYGAIIILTDQDPDGSHIKGLIINLFEYFWPSLLKLEGFIKTINTPIIKAWKKTDKKKTDLKIFYTISDFHKWEKEKLQGDLSKWEHKYYKGLGTSTEKEAKESFCDFDERLISFIWEHESIEEDIDSETPQTKSKSKSKSKSKLQNNNDNENDNDNESVSGASVSNASNDYCDEQSKSHLAISKAFDKKKVNDRKVWLKKFDRENLIEYKGNTKIPYSDFIDKDLIFFSNMDNDRSIPSMVDGLKPSQRKILYACFKRGRHSKEVKVAQLAGYVSEHTEYHHGEESLNMAIIGLAQNFPGSNNINLLTPNGNFGYRRLGGKEHSSPRYIFTEINPLTNKIFREEDECILEYNYDDGKQVEPIYYIPILPFTLVNGASGIGTGFSTSILPYNPKDIVANLKRLINKEDQLEMTPWFNGFNGNIEEIDNNQKGRRYKITGKYTINGRTVRITEIPIVDGWIEPFEKKLEQKQKIEEINSITSNNLIDITLTFNGQELQQLFKKDGEIEKYLGLAQTVSETNLHLYNSNCKLTKYDNVDEIIRDFYTCRLEMYKKRRTYFLAKMQNELDIYKYKVKFIKDYLDGVLKINRKKISDVIEQLEMLNFPKMAHAHDVCDADKSYRYLTDMTILTLTEDKIKELESKMKECEMIHTTYLNTPIKKIWLSELDEFLCAYETHIELWNIEMCNADKDQTKKKKKTSSK